MEEIIDLKTRVQHNSRPQPKTQDRLGWMWPQDRVKDFGAKRDHCERERLRWCEVLKREMG